MNALDLVKAAVAEWRKNRGDQSTYLRCQHFDGWYVQWAYEGFTASAEKSIVVYPSAAAAARESAIFTKDVNSADIEPGDLIYWNWGQYGHVGTVVGRDGARVLVSHTSNAGDEVLALGNHVRVSHADTVNLNVYGVSHTNGRNKRRAGLTGYNVGGAASAPAPAGGQSLNLYDGWAWYLSAAEAIAEHNPHGPKWTGEKLARGVYPVLSIVDGAFEVRANDGSAIWISPKARDRLSGAGAPAPTPAKRLYVRLSASWFYHKSEAAARAAKKNHKGPMLPAADYLVLRGSGPYEVASPLGNVWVGTGRTNPPTVRK